MINLTIANITYVDMTLIILLLVCCYTDLRSKKIYNAVLLPAVLVAFIASLTNGGWSACLVSVKGLLAGMALLLIPFAAGGIGAGDVKLLGTIGAFKGPEFVLMAFLTGAVVGGIFSVYLLIRQGRLLLTLKKFYYFFISKVLHIPVSVSFGHLDVATRGESFPYALAISLGAAWAYFLL